MQTLGAELAVLQDLGLELPSVAYIVGALLFSVVGMWAWWRGKKQPDKRTRWLGLALMLYPYLTPWTWLLYAVGIGLCATLYIHRRA